MACLSPSLITHIYAFATSPCHVFPLPLLLRRTTATISETLGLRLPPFSLRCYPFFKIVQLLIQVETSKRSGFAIFSLLFFGERYCVALSTRLPVPCIDVISLSVLTFLVIVTEVTINGNVGVQLCS